MKLAGSDRGAPQYAGVVLAIDASSALLLMPQAWWGALRCGGRGGAGRARGRVPHSGGPRGPGGRGGGPGAGLASACPGFQGRGAYLRCAQ